MSEPIRSTLVVTAAAGGVVHLHFAEPLIYERAPLLSNLPGPAEYEARATSREDSRAQLCDALGLPGLTWDEALAEVRRRGGTGEQAPTPIEAVNDVLLGARLWCSAEDYAAMNLADRDLVAQWVAGGSALGDMPEALRLCARRLQ